MTNSFGAANGYCISMDRSVRVERDEDEGRNCEL